MNRDTHLDDEEIAAYVDGGLDADARQRAAAHLVECDECRGLLASTGRLTAPPARGGSRRLMVVGGLAAAAAALVLLLPNAPTPDSAPRTRDVEAAGRNGLHFTAYGPAEGVPVGRDTLTFRWAAAGAGGDVTYQVTVSSEAGAIVWTGRTTDTVLAPPDSLTSRLEAGRIYYWQVDAILPNLRAATTGQRRLVPAP